MVVGAWGKREKIDMKLSFNDRNISQSKTKHMTDCK